MDNPILMVNKKRDADMKITSLHKRFFKERDCLIYFLLVLICLFSLKGYGEGANLFSSQSLEVEGRMLSVMPTDLDGKGFAEIVVTHKTGIYPNEKRWISVFSTDTLARYATTPCQRWEVDPAATLFDVGDIAPSPGKEILYLTGQGLRYYHQEANNLFSSTPHHLLSFPTITVFPAAGSLPRGRLFADWKRNGRKMLLLPQFHSLMFFERDDSESWQKTDRVAVGSRAFLFSDQVDDGAFRDFSLHAEFRLPRIFLEDFNGDHLPDLLLTEQETVTVHLHKPDGHFSPEPTTTVVFPVRPTGKNAEASPSFLSTPVDVNGDEFVDVILTLTKSTGKFLERRIVIFIFLNQRNPENPFSPQPDQTITLDGITPGVNMEDVNGDGRADLLLSYIRVGFWNIVKNLISKQVNLNTSIFLLRSDNRYPMQPDFHRQTSYQIDLTHGVRFHGTWPTLGGDFTGDGHKDLLIARDEKIAVYPKNMNGDLFSKPLTQSGVFTSPFMHIVDLDSDDRDDLLFYEKKEGGKIVIHLNTAEWKEKPSSKNETTSRTEN